MVKHQGFVSKHCHLMGATTTTRRQERVIELRDTASHRERWYCGVLSHLTQRGANLVLADSCLQRDLRGHKCGNVLSPSINREINKPTQRTSSQRIGTARSQEPAFASSPQATKRMIRLSQLIVRFVDIAHRLTRHHSGTPPQSPTPTKHPQCHTVECRQYVWYSSHLTTYQNA